MYVRNSITNDIGVWLATRSKEILVWNSDKNTQETWIIDNTECIEQVNDAEQDDFLNFLRVLSSSELALPITDKELVELASKSLKYYLDAGCFTSKKSVEDSIKTVQEVLYHVFGEEQFGHKRDELLMFVHLKIPSIFWGAYWGYCVGKKENKDPLSKDTEPEKFEQNKTKKQASWCCFRKRRMNM